MPAAIDLEASISQVEQHLEGLGQAMRAHNAEGVELEALALQRALAAAVQRLNHARRTGEVPPGLRQRLALATGQMASQRESLARATAALDRAIDVLMPSATPRVAYTSSGSLAQRGLRAAVLQA
jgi:hypothetical protein